MLVLFETPAGLALFKLLDEKKLKNVDDVWSHFDSPQKANSNLELVTFKKFKSTAEAVELATSLIDGKVHKSLKKLLKSKVEEGEKLAVGDTKLGSLIKEKFSVPCVHNAAIDELMRGIRAHVDDLLGEHKAELNAMNLAVAHSLGRYKVKFNPEKIDTMIVQAVSLLDDLDKELNNYVMRVREWYGWHFPELGKLIQDHQAFAKVVKEIGMRQNAVNTELSAILPEELESKVKEEAEISMGTDISDLDLIHIRALCDQVLELTQYRAQLFDYLKNRMSALAPNLTVLLGELVGARLISHAGSLVSLAKAPASTVQLLGAEKALFRSLKMKKDTPKYGLIYHAQLIASAPAKLKGKMARKLASKSALAARIDALADESKGPETGIESRAWLEKVLREEQERPAKKIGGGAKGGHKHEKYHFKSETFEYDSTFDAPKSGKRKTFEEEEGGAGEGKPPKAKKSKVEVKEEEAEAAMEVVDDQEESGKKKSKKDKKKKSKGGDEEEE